MFELFKEKKVFITGNTGFKGSWLSLILLNKGARVKGYSLGMPTCPSLFEYIGLKNHMESIDADIRNYDKVLNEIQKFQPDYVFHLAAQPIVRESYKNPRYTYETNIMGTVNLLESIRYTESVRSVVNITTDKVYENHELQRGYHESEPLNGDDPYSNSKSCSELVTSSYKHSFFNNNIVISTARAGNVIGGGDFAKDRIIPDCIRAIENQEVMSIRNPNSVRPYQHVLEPISVYLMIALEQLLHPELAGSYNVGPNDKDCVTTKHLVEIFAELWGDGFSWKIQGEDGPLETTFLKLDNTKLKKTFSWQPKWDIKTALEGTVEWNRCHKNGGNILNCMEGQIKKYLGE
jgi:CDP-glucose 4,6-dehydratase